MSKGKRELSAEERALWRRVSDGVKRGKQLGAVRALPEIGKACRTPNPVGISAKPRASSTRTEISDRGGEKRVRRGRVEIGGTLDLHGHTQTTARRALARFVASASRRGDRVVIIVTGVGRSGDGVLRKRLPEWLAEADLRSLVSGFAGAHRSHGGPGAFYVFLKSNRDTDAG